jgi:hypothetical protein
VKIRGVSLTTLTVAVIFSLVSPNNTLINPSGIISPKKMKNIKRSNAK